ncbi:MAG: M23 family metallopeptidase, partial [Oscillospiraceae bacterium]|nr:M23 family metallopeptidase [Oscillospiraceae bacterium]
SADAPEQTGAAAAPPDEEPAPAAAEAPPVQETATAKPYFIWPVTGELETGYAMASLIYDSTMRDWRTHDGLDIAAPIGTQVHAAANGTVASVYSDERYGVTVTLRHSGGLSSTYANLAATPTVSEGQEVAVGQVIGAVGDTALCEVGAASHLHFSMSRDGVSVDPTEFMP